MVLRAGPHRGDDEETAERTPADAAPVLPNLEGDLDEVIDNRPVFRTRLHGYDRLEVDNYTAWATAELVTVRREADHLLSRFGEFSAELEISRRLLADARWRESFPISERLQEMLRLAAEEAGAITDAARQEADRLLAEARTEADARLRKAHEVKELAVGAADELKRQARGDRTAAAAALEGARTEAAQILRQAAADRDRLAAEAAADRNQLAADAAAERDRLAAQAAADRNQLAADAAAERDRLAAQAAREREQAAAVAAAELAAVQAEVDELHRRQDQARQSLRRLTDMIGEALQTVAATAPDNRAGTDVTTANVAVEGMVRDGRDEPPVAAMAGRPAPVPR
jgi:cell division septum initiation protein DivIVA